VNELELSIVVYRHFQPFFSYILIDWYLTPTLAVCQLYLDYPIY